MKIKIGKYSIVKSDGELWIFDDSVEGEGGEFSEEDFEKVIEEFYEKNF